MTRVAVQEMTVLMADDDPDDRLLIREAFDECRIDCNLQFFDDGPALIDYLYQCVSHEGSVKASLPQLILLDLNMPRKDGREVLAEIKANDDLRVIPVIVLTTSQNEHDILLAYHTGAASYIVKPESFQSLMDFVQRLNDYWLTCVRLPFFAKEESERAND
ncbi:MAG: response regulator [Thermodesulfobacteriota bacterium]|nr:response regulator [Thermodesulfobacteriota bacterium]